MVIRIICSALLKIVCSVNVVVDQQSVVYGKYYSISESGRNTEDNSYFMYRPQVHNAGTQGKLPTIIHIHEGGFTTGSPITSINEEVQQAINNGFAYISVGYRLITTKYYYDDDRAEELINVDADGRLTIDKAGRTMDDYKIRRAYMEHATKCHYDATQMIEHLIAHADEYGIDMHRFTFAGNSVGGGLSNYLIWVYHQWNIGRYTPRGMVYYFAQLDYPVGNMLDRLGKIWTDDVGEGILLSSILAKSDCSAGIGNPYCGAETVYNLCNMTYHKETTSRFCGDSFEHVTLAEVRDALVWPIEDPEVGKGMEVLWYNSVNMQKHQPKPFYLYVANYLNGTDVFSFAHNGMYARNYAKYAGMAGINYTVYYPDYNAMTAEDQGNRYFTFDVGNTEFVLNYWSNHGWANQPEFQIQNAGNFFHEGFFYHCFALGVQCSLTPSRTCQEEVDRICSAPLFVSDCASCIRTQIKTFMDAGCTTRCLIAACPSLALRFV